MNGINDDLIAARYRRGPHEILKKEKVWHIEKHPLIFTETAVSSIEYLRNLLCLKILSLWEGNQPLRSPQHDILTRLGSTFSGEKNPNFQIDIAFLESSSDCLEMLSCLQEQQGGGLPPRAQASQAGGVGSLLSNIWNKRCQASWYKIIPGILVLLNVNYKMWISVSNGLFCWLQNRGGFLLPLPICTLHLECGGVLLDKNKILGLAG